MKNSMKRFISIFLLLCIAVSLLVVPASAARRDTATPVIQNAFNKDQTKSLNGYAEGYGWDMSKNGQDEWVSDITDETVHWAEGNQLQFYYDNESTTMQHLWNYVFGGGGYGSGGWLGLGSLTGSGSDIVTVAMTQLGVGETPPGSNQNRFVSWFYGSSTASAPWCCIFVSWCATQCGYIDQGIFERTASSSEMFRYMTNVKGYQYCSVQDVWRGRDVPQAGDIIFFKAVDDARPTQMEHIGIVVSYDAENNKLITVEGNTGNMVKQKTYSPTTNYVALQRGYIVRPAYPSTPDGVDESE